MKKQQSELQKLLDKAEKSTKQTIKFGMQANFEKKLFNHYMFKMLLSQKEMERLRRLVFEKMNGRKRKTDNKLAAALQNITDRYGYYSRKTMEMQTAIYHKARALDNVDNLSELEKKILREDPSIRKNINRMVLGTIEQIDNFWEGIFAQLIKLKAREKESQKFFRRRLAGFVKLMRYKYRVVQLSEGDIYDAMILAAGTWEKAKYRGYIAWIKVQMEIFFKKERKQFLQNESVEIPVGLSVLKPKYSAGVSVPDGIVLRDDEDRPIEEFEEGALFNEMLKGRLSKIEKPQEISVYYRSKEMWIEEAARQVGVSPQTLRNWDNDGTFKASRKKILGKSYRIYDPQHISELKRIKEEKKNKRNGMSSKDHWSIAQVSKCLKISVKTLKRKEHKGLVPKARRYKGTKYRYYTLSDIKKVAQVLGRQLPLS